ncbi:MAG: multiple sugar transport system permease protein [Thermomicrobiales bacterium]|nr:multiple sugar transport system permease protein [Thermomicrobiales bacterium]
MSSTPVAVTPARIVAAKRSKAIGRDRWFAFWLVLPTILAVLGVSVYPVGYAIWTSLHNKNPSFGFELWVGLGNYRLLLESPEFRKAIAVTARFAVTSTVLSMLLGLGMALVLNQRFIGRGLLRSVILVPWAMSGTVVGVLWAWIYDGGYGTLNGVLFKLGLIDEYKAWLSAFEIPGLGPASLYFVVVAFVWNSAPMAALFILAALQSVPTNLYRAAKMDGASAWQRFRFITLPWLRPMLLLVLILSSINGIMAFDLIYFLTKGGPGTETTVFSWLGYNTIFGFFQFGQGTAILLALTLICLVLAFVYMKLLDRKPSQKSDLRGTTEATVQDLEDDLQRRSVTYATELAALSRASGSGTFTPPRSAWRTTRRARIWKDRVIYFPAAVIAFWSLAPVAWLLICSVAPFTDLLTKPPVFWPDASLDNYRRIFTGATAADTAGVPLVAQRVPNALLNSFVVATAVTAICLVLGSLSGYAYARLSHVKFLGPTLIAMMMTRMIPGLAIMVPWFILFSKAGLSNTKLGLIISYASFSIPLVLWIMKTYFETVPVNLERAAAVDGCNRLQTLYRVVLPIAVPGLIAAGLFAFIASWNEFIFALNLAQDNDSMTITYVIAQIFGVVLYGPQNYGTLFAAGILAILPPVFLAFVFQRYLVQGLTAGSVKG